jgi:hypothetical protein
MYVCMYVCAGRGRLRTAAFLFGRFSGAHKPLPAVSRRPQQRTFCRRVLSNTTIPCGDPRSSPVRYVSVCEGTSGPALYCICSPVRRPVKSYRRLPLSQSFGSGVEHQPGCGSWVARRELRSGEVNTK